MGKGLLERWNPDDPRLRSSSCIANDDRNNQGFAEAGSIA
jgi:hypothetical protein